MPTTELPNPDDLDAQDVQELFPFLRPRKADGHKGSYGRVLVLAGSYAQSGAAALAGTAALRGGAGLVSVACPHAAVPMVAGHEPALMTVPLPQDADGAIAAAAVATLMKQDFDVLALGPGLSTSAGVAEVVRRLVTAVEQPLVIDADGLNVLAGRTDLLRHRPGPTVLTPHPGEFARLTGVAVADAQKDRTGSAERFARDFGVVVVLKGDGTVVTDGKDTSVNPTGNPGMATGGTGDVLTGVVAAILAAGRPPLAAARAAVYLHGLAGDHAADELGECSMISSDLLAFLSSATTDLADLGWGEPEDR